MTNSKQNERTTIGMDDIILDEGDISTDEEGRSNAGKRNREMREEEGEEPSAKKSSETLIQCVYKKCNRIQWNLIPKEIRNNGVNYTTCEAVEKDKHTAPHDDLLRLGTIFRGKMINRRGTIFVWMIGGSFSSGVLRNRVR